MFDLESNTVFINIGAPVVVALIISLITWIVRLLNERKKHENQEKNELVTTVAGLVSAVNEITISLGGAPATTFEKKRDGIIEAVAILAAQVASLTTVVNEHTETLNFIKENK